MKTINDLIKPETRVANLVESIISEVYEWMPYGKIAAIIKEFQDIKVSDSLIETYLEKASSRKFTFDPIIFEIRKLNKFDNNLVENKMEFVLEDNSTIVLTNECFQYMRSILEYNQEAIDFMIGSKENFLKMFEIINKGK